ncbi:hypothetical protein [Gelidibacter gilvus]|uniref:hypothetical protein n=1 Tax=Gelidibacter gilvus TaxID=59602 RepID=UPI00167DE060|nr:hypothetical protein [Gelidibacter gilvus]
MDKKQTSEKLFIVNKELAHQNEENTNRVVEFIDVNRTVEALEKLIKAAKKIFYK